MISKWFRWTKSSTYRSGLRLGSLDNLSVELRGRGLVELGEVLESTGPDGIQEPQGTESIDISRVLCHVERHLDVRLRSKVAAIHTAVSIPSSPASRNDPNSLNLVGLHLADDVHQVGGVGQISVVKDHVFVLVQVLDSSSVEGR